MYVLDYSTEESTLTITGDIAKLEQIKDLWFYFNNQYEVKSSSDSILTLKIETDDLSVDFEEIKEWLEELELPVQVDSRADSSLDRIQNERREFEIRSKHAKEIYWGNPDRKEVEALTRHLEKSFKSGRVLDWRQTLSAVHLSFSLNSCNFSVPGSGKTTTVYAGYSHLKEKGSVDKILVIGPQSCFRPWESEYQKCFNETPNSIRLNKVSSNERVNFLKSKVSQELILMSFATMANFVDQLIEFLELNSKVMVVIDEAHYIKRVDGGVWAPAALKISPYAASRVVLTGTPAPNGYEDLFNLFEFIWPKKNLIPFGLSTLMDLSEKTIKKGVIDTHTNKKINQVVDSLKPYFVRIRKKDLGLPEPIDHPVITVEMSPLQKKIYDSIEDKELKDFVNLDEENIDDDIFKAKLIRLRQAATNPNTLSSLVHEFGMDNTISAYENEILTDISQFQGREVPPKFLAARDLIKNIISRNEKVVVWATFVQNLLEFQDFLSKNNVSSKVIYGDVPVEDEDNTSQEEETREDIINEFHQEDSSFKVLIANAATVGESISLHEACNNAIYIERDFNAASYLQSRDRIHRKGISPDTKTNYYFLESKHSIDESITLRLEDKIENLKRIVEHDIPLFSNFHSESMADIKAIISNYESRNR